MKPDCPVMSTDTPKKGGRAKMYPNGVRNVTVSLDDETIRKGRELGAGNLSVGIRKALSLAASAEPDPQIV